MTQTTEQIITRQSRLKAYETLEMKRRYNSGYETDWQDLSTYLLSGSDLKVTAKLDFDSFGYGEFKTSNLNFMLNNTLGYFNDENDFYSFFSNTVSRHYTKVRYKAGYYDGADKVDEIVFTGLVNEKEIQNNFIKGTIEFTVLSLNQILHETFVSSGSLSSTNYFSQMVSAMMNTTMVSDYISYSAGNINPDTNLYFDAPTYYEDKPIAEVLNEICKRANSVWYIENDALIVRNRVLNTNMPFNFIGGSAQKYSTNILEIESYDEGFSKLINTVIYKTDQTYQETASSELLAKYGQNSTVFESTDITDSATISSLSTAIIDEWKYPKKRIVLTTVYMPNVIDFLDRCTISYKPKLKSFFNKTTMIWNGGGKFNNNEVWGVYSNRIILNPDRYWAYYGYEHDIAKGITRHYLVESDFIGAGISTFVWNLGQWNNGEKWNAN
jgi:hypothetical protein